MYQSLLTSLENGIFTITINRPDKLNALNKTVMSELNDVMDEVYNNTTIKSVIITGAGQKAFVAGLTTESLAGRVSYENLQGETWEYSLAHMIQHVVNHSTHHRGQVAAYLRQLGRVPPITDFLVYLDEGSPEG